MITLNDIQYMLGDTLLVKPVTKPLNAGGNETDVLLPPGRWYDWFSRTCFDGGRTVRVPTPLNRFPVFVRAGGILPLAGGAQCAADVPVPAREFLVCGGADGTFQLYDDEGDGYGCGLTIPMNYRDAGKTLETGTLSGTLKEPVRMTFRLRDPDGSEVSREVLYNGKAAVLAV